MNFEEKIKSELKSFKGDAKARAVHKEIADTILTFCRQDDEFAQAVEQGSTLSDCCKAVCDGVGGSISDIEAYRKAVQFYFPGAGISFTMRINLCASVDNGDEQLTSEPEIKPSKVLNMSLDSLLDF